MSDEDSFVGRWSRRKRAADRPAVPAVAAEAEKTLAPEPEAPAPAPISDEELAALPRIEDLVPGSDIRAFLRPGVPKALKNAAMRKMWMITPAIRDHDDPAVDYAWDWNTPGGVPGSGGAVSGESLAKQLKALRQTPADKGSDTDEPAKPTAGNDAGNTVSRLSAKPLAEPADDDGANDDTRHEREPDSARNGKSDATTLPLPRRHGGAMPT